eukprot:TRINITY_DN1320_c0_g1_i3.p1 TRINITY_DN1320_c0_g1~~TRINITY_DN1320_c0_g1_i3.p1  ORF type:complete len:300 (+),score=67.35 TRINITY_DN1320_c0_g1_i3:359-1258(+)
MMTRVSILLIFACVTLVLATVRDDYVLTPHGYRYPECVLRVPSGSSVVEDGEHLRITLPLEEGQTTAMEKLYEVPASCHTDIVEIKRALQAKKQNLNTTNGWLDNAGWYPPSGQNDLHTFTSTYTIPFDPTDKNGGQTLFYFIGLVDYDAPSNYNIIQPVLTWGNGRNQWYVESWACCPKNISVSSAPLLGLKAGQQLTGVVVRDSASTWLINSIWDGKSTELRAQVGDMNYNWADVTLEVYNINACNQLANGRALFTNLNVKDAQGSTLSPRWSFTGATLCQGHTTQPESTTVEISHN